MIEKKCDLAAKRVVENYKQFKSFNINCQCYEVDIFIFFFMV